MDIDLDNQKDYWNKVAGKKEFTHPLNSGMIKQYFNKDDKILDYGCGYGRITHQLINIGFTNVIGFDTSSELIKRGKALKDLPIYHIGSPQDLAVDNESLDGIILFAVLTCIPSNKGQSDLIKILHSKLKPGGIMYVSDYYLQADSKEMERYEYLNDNKENYGVFTLNEGATFRHHTKEWINKLLGAFRIVEENRIEVLTMNQHKAEGFQIIAVK